MTEAVTLGDRDEVGDDDDVTVPIVTIVEAVPSCGLLRFDGRLPRSLRLFAVFDHAPGLPIAS